MVCTQDVFDAIAHKAWVAYRPSWELGEEAEAAAWKRYTQTLRAAWQAYFKVVDGGKELMNEARVSGKYP